MIRASIIVALLAIAAPAQAAQARGAYGAAQQQSLLQTYNKALTGAASGGKVTPVTRVVNLLKEMSATLNKEMEEDEGLYKELACWCGDGKYEKKLAIEAATEKVSDLTATIEMLTAKSKELNTKIKELEAEVAADKEALAEATALRQKQLKEFQGMELDSIAAIENLKGAIVVLGKHQGSAFPQIPLSFLQWGPDHESHMSFAFDEFLRKENFQLGSKGPSATQTQGHFLQAAVQGTQQGWANDDVAIVKKAVSVASALLQARHGHKYFPSYNAQSGEIFGVLKQLKEEMEGDLSEAQKTEAARAATFAELRSAKTEEIETGEAMAETKEDELATTDMDLAEAKEDLGQTEKTLAEDQTFMANLEKTCADADAAFAERKKARLSEIEAVSQTIEILTGDDAKDAMDTTFSFVQTSSTECNFKAIDSKGFIEELFASESAMQ